MARAMASGGYGALYVGPLLSISWPVLASSGKWETGLPDYFDFSASRSNAVYTDSGKVRPNSVVLSSCIKY